MDVGVCFHRDEPAGTVTERARAAESLGFDEFWVIEDCFYTAGVSLAAAALTATSSLTVGIGILPVVARNAAVTAMEFATLGALAPGRFHAGLGHGVQTWMQQMHARVASPLTVLDETLIAVGRLLDGETVSVDGRYVSLDQVALDAPPVPVPLISAGVRGPKSMAIAGRSADGVILADFVSAEYVQQVRDQLGPGDHRITVFATVAATPDEDVAAEIRRDVAHFLAEVAADAPASLKAVSWWSEFEAQAGQSSWLEAATQLSAERWNDISCVGTIDGAHRYVADLAAAGVDALCVFPSPDDPQASTASIAEWLLA